MNKFLTLCSVLLLGVVGCEKDGGNEPDQPRRVKTITAYDATSTTDAPKFEGVMVFDYDAQGRIVAVKSYENMERTKVRGSMTVNYGSPISYQSIFFSDGEEYISNFTASLDAHGRASIITEMLPGGENPHNYEVLSYNDQGYLATSNQNNNPFTLKWENGNFVEGKWGISSGTYQTTTNITYDATVLGSMNLDLNWLLYEGGEGMAFIGGAQGGFPILTAQGYCGKRNTHMVKTCKNIVSDNRTGTDVDGTYTYNELNCPVEIKQTETYRGEASLTRFTITYE